MNVARLARIVLYCFAFLLFSYVMMHNSWDQFAVLPSTVTKTASKGEDWKAIANRFKLRVQRLRTICKSKIRLPMNHWKPNSNFLIDVPRRLLLCAVPKSGSTAWHRTIWAARRIRSNMSCRQELYTPADTVRNQGIAMNLPSQVGSTLIQSVNGDDDFMNKPPINSSFRIILARHPFARFISGWNQKFMLSINYWVLLVKLFPKLLEYKKEIDPNRVMSFGDFAKFAAENPREIRKKDGHFMPATDLCSPCEYDYTYVVKAETFDADEDWLKHRLGLVDIDIGRRGVPPGGSVVNDNLKKNIKNFMSKLSGKTVKALYDLYKSDFEYFGYTFDFKTLEAGGFD